MHQECHEAPPLENDLTHIANLQSRRCRYLYSCGSLFSSLLPLPPFSFRPSPLPLTIPYTLVVPQRVSRRCRYSSAQSTMAAPRRSGSAYWVLHVGAP